MIFIELLLGKLFVKIWEEGKETDTKFGVSGGHIPSRYSLPPRKKEKITFTCATEPSGGRLTEVGNTNRIYYIIKSTTQKHCLRDDKS